jgi:hypothetical protein
VISHEVIATIVSAPAVRGNGNHEVRKCA